MPSTNLQLTLTRDRYSITPLPAQIERRCTFSENCRNRASHRLLLSEGFAGVELLCDAHAAAWARNHGLHITTAKLSEQF